MLTNTPRIRTGERPSAAAGRSGRRRLESRPVDSPAPQIELVRPWRTATLVASGIAAVELIALVILGVVMLGRSLAPHVHAAAAQAARAPKHAAAPAKHKAKTQPTRSTHAARILPRTKVNVIILNGNGIDGAAASAAALVTARGYKVKEVGNAEAHRLSRLAADVCRGFARRGQAVRPGSRHVGLDGRPAQLYEAEGPCTAPQLPC